MFWAEWRADAKRDEYIRLWKLSLKGETILQMTQQIPPKATLTFARRRCHSTELKTHWGPWYYSVLLAQISVCFYSFFFFWSRHHFPLSPFLSHSRDPNKTPTAGSCRITVGSDCDFVNMEARRVDLQLWIPVVLSIKRVGTRTVSEETQRSDASRTLPSLIRCCMKLR